MPQNDRDDPGMRVIKKSDKKFDKMNLSFHYHSVIPGSSYNNLSYGKQISCNILLEEVMDSFSERLKVKDN